jgi:hypothetical protein
MVGEESGEGGLRRYFGVEPHAKFTAEWLSLSNLGRGWKINFSNGASFLG